MLLYKYKANHTNMSYLIKIKERENLKILFNKIDDLSDEEIERIAKIIELTVPKKEH